MRVWKEIITVTSISRMYRDHVSVSGINQGGKWLRLQHLHYDDALNQGQDVFKSLCQTALRLYDMGNYRDNQYQRIEDSNIILDEEKLPQLTKELSADEQKRFLDKHLDKSVYDIFNKGRSLGLIKPIIHLVEFSWNPYSEDYEARFVFRDSSGQKFDFPCVEVSWRNYWISILQEDPHQITHHLMRMQWHLNDQDTYFVVGLTNSFPEMPGPFNGCWPMVLGVHSIAGPEYIKEYHVVT